MQNTLMIEKYLCAKPGVIKDYKPEWDWDRYLIGGRMFAAVCCPGVQHAPEYAGHTLLSLKCDPFESELLRKTYGDILPGFYMDKRNWISIRLHGDVPGELMLKLCDASYDLVFSKLTKRAQKEIMGE